MDTVAQVLETLLLETGMVDSELLEQIKTGQISDDQLRRKFLEYRDAFENKPKAVKDRYVLGFVFNKDRSRVLLIDKKRPAWQAGKLNGIGGKIEEGETPLEAMHREFKEETFFDHIAFIDKSRADEYVTFSYVGKRTRPAIYDLQPGSFEMFVYATFVDDVRRLVYEDDDCLKTTNEYVTYWTYDVEAPHSPDREYPIAVPMNRQVIANNGVDGLAGLMDLSLQALVEGFSFKITDAQNLELGEG